MSEIFGKLDLSEREAKEELNEEDFQKWKEIQKARQKVKTEKKRDGEAVSSVLQEFSKKEKENARTDLTFEYEDGSEVSIPVSLSVPANFMGLIQKMDSDQLSEEEEFDIGLDLLGDVTIDGNKNDWKKIANDVGMGAVIKAASAFIKRYQKKMSKYSD